MLVVVVAGVVIRFLTMMAYQPALFFGDSWGYITSAYSGHLFGTAAPTISNFRPSGYPALIWLLATPGRDIAQLITLQHLAGVVAGVLVYVALLRAAVLPGLAACAAALVLLDGYAITLEQYVMADTVFSLIVLCACIVWTWPALGEPRNARIGTARAAAGGLLLAAATLVRLEALFIAPAVVVYLLWRRSGWQALLAVVLAAGAPLAAYAAAESARYGTFGLSQWGGWTAYARVAGFADCAGAGVPVASRPLCESVARRASHPDASDWYLFDPASPAIHLFGPLSRSVSEQRRSDGLLESFAVAIARHQPLDVASAVLGDFLEFFEPDTAQYGDATGATVLPSAAGAEYVDTYARDRFLRGVEPTVGSPSAALRRYRSVIHVPRPLIALLALASVVGVACALRWRREVLLFSGSGILLLLGTAATAGFAQRYLLCAVPPLAIGGTLSLRELVNNTVTNRRGARPRTETGA